MLTVFTPQYAVPSVAPSSVWDGDAWSVQMASVAPATPGVEGEVIIEIGERVEEVREDSGGLEIFDIAIGCPGQDGDSAQTQCADDIFTFEVGPRNDRGETESYVRSQFGPLMVSEDLSEVSLYLPGPRVLSYGMEELVWSGGRHVTRFNFNQESSVHLPVILCKF